MAESVDALVSNTSGATHPGSIPGLGTEERNRSFSLFYSTRTTNDHHDRLSFRHNLRFVRSIYSNCKDYQTRKVQQTREDERSVWRKGWLRHSPCIVFFNSHRYRCIFTLQILHKSGIKTKEITAHRKDGPLFYNVAFKRGRIITFCFSSSYRDVLSRNNILLKGVLHQVALQGNRALLRTPHPTNLRV